MLAAKTGDTGSWKPEFPADSDAAGFSAEHVTFENPVYLAEVVLLPLLVETSLRKQVGSSGNIPGLLFDVLKIVAGFCLLGIYKFNVTSK
jgi:hypothetical protein